MTKKVTIGPAVFRRRRELGWSMQRLCEAAGNSIFTSYISDLEKENVNPTVDKAYSIAQAFGTTIDTLIEETLSPGMRLGPAEAARRVPIVPWSMASEYAKSRDASRLPGGTHWILPPENGYPRLFALIVPDESMHAPAGIAFPAGSTIFVDPDQEAQLNDFVVGYRGDPAMPMFKKLVADGAQRYLRALNPQFPMQHIDGDFACIGVVVGMTMRLARGMIR